jgi:cytochrome c oxidase subunit 4
MTEAVAVQVRGYLVVFGALLVLTLTTVAASYLDLSAGPAVALGLAIAVVKAGLVAAFFMHLSHERALIYAALVLTAVLFVSLIGLTLWSEMTHPPGTRFAGWSDEEK